MRIITKRRLREFWANNPDAENAIEQWIEIVENADWESFADVRNIFAHASIYRHLTIFNIGGNKYRLITIIEYQKHLVFIRQIMTHNEYDKNKWKEDV